MKNIALLLSALLALIALSACSTFSLDKEKAAEHRKQELCQEIETKDLPHCSGSLESKPPE